MADERAIDDLAELASHLAAATARFVELVWDQRERFGEHVASFVAYRCGITGREAKEFLRVAEALRELPLIRAAFGRGEVTYARVRALAGVVTPPSEPQLLELAGALSASQLQGALRVYRRVTAERRSQELEHVSWWFADDGALILSARLAAEDGALVVRALEAARERVDERRREEQARAAGGEAVTGIRDVPRPVGVEALVELAEAALSVEEEPVPTRARLVVHVDAAALAAGAAGCCELEHGSVIAPETARRLGCDADLVAQIEFDGLPVRLGRSRRTVTPAQRRLLEARDSATCCFPGCERSRHLQAHHLQHWIDGGETNLDNLALLCHLHHRLVHEGGYTVEPCPDGQRIAVSQRSWPRDLDDPAETTTGKPRPAAGRAHPARPPDRPQDEPARRPGRHHPLRPPTHPLGHPRHRPTRRHTPLERPPTRRTRRLTPSPPGWVSAHADSLRTGLSPRKNDLGRARPTVRGRSLPHGSVRSCGRGATASSSSEAETRTRKPPAACRRNGLRRPETARTALPAALDRDGSLAAPRDDDLPSRARP